MHKQKTILYSDIFQLKCKFTVFFFPDNLKQKALVKYIQKCLNHLGLCYFYYML